MGNTQKIVCFVFLVILSCYSVNAIISVEQPGSYVSVPKTVDNCIEIDFSRGGLFREGNDNLYLPVPFIFGDLSQCELFEGELDENDNCFIDNKGISVETYFKWTAADGLATYEQINNEYQFRENEYPPWVYNGTPIQSILVEYAEDKWNQTGWCPPLNRDPRVYYVCYNRGGISGKFKICKERTRESPLKNHAIHSIEQTKRNLKNSMIIADSYSEINSVFGVSTCANNLLNFPIQNKYVKIGSDFLKEVIEVISEDAVGNALEVALIENYSIAAEKVTESNFSGFLNSVEEVDDSVIIEIEETGFATDVYRLQRKAILESSEWIHIVEDHNTAYENSKLARSVVFLAGTSVISLYIPGSGTLVPFLAGLLVDYSGGIIECSLDSYSVEDHRLLLVDSVKKMVEKSIVFADKIENGMLYLESNAEFPSIEYSLNQDKITIINTGYNSVKVDIEYQIDYTAPIFDGVPRNQNYQAIKSVELFPGETRVISLDEEQYILDWISELSSSCSISVEKFDISKEYEVNIFYGEEETIALKELSFELTERYECNKCFLNSDCDEELVADINNDCAVDIYDLSFIAMRFGTSPGDALWNSKADIYSDDSINIFDLSLVGRQFGLTCS